MEMNSPAAFAEASLFLLATLPVPLLIWTKAILENRKLTARVRRVETNLRMAKGTRVRR